MVSDNRNITTLARQIGISRHALYRHRDNHMGELLQRVNEVRKEAAAEAAIEVARTETRADYSRALNVMRELERCFIRTNKMFDACDKWLRDPVDPEEYFLGPRVHDVDVMWFEIGDRGRVINHRERLSAILDRVSGATGEGVETVEIRHADPRELLLKSTKTLNSLMSFLARLKEQLEASAAADPTQSDAWNRIRTILLEELADYPEARARIAERLVRELGSV